MAYRGPACRLQWVSTMKTLPLGSLGSIVFLLGCSSGGGIQAADGGGGGAGGARLDAGAEVGADTTVACAASGASCAASGCCLDPSESCLAQAIDRLCLHSQPPPREGPACNGAASSTLDGVSITFPDDR